MSKYFYELIKNAVKYSLAYCNCPVDSLDFWECKSMLDLKMTELVVTSFSCW